MSPRSRARPRTSVTLRTSAKCCARLRATCFVRLHKSFAANDAVYTALEDCGSALATMNIRVAAGKRFWDGALRALDKARLSHFDITEYNIVVRDDSAKLIDLESVTAFGKPCESSPTAAVFRFKRPKQAAADFDAKCVCAVLYCLSVDKISSFLERAESVQQAKVETMTWTCALLLVALAALCSATNEDDTNLKVLSPQCESA